MSTSSMDAAAQRTTARALDTKGSSDSAALVAVVRRLLEADGRKDTLVDVGCGTGRLYAGLRECFTRYIGLDVVRYADFPVATDATFHLCNLDTLHDADRLAPADVVCCIETIEHLENPRALVRALDTLVKPGGRVIISTPNQLSLLSKLCLLTRNQFVHFQEGPGLYPAHLTALLECDLRRLASEVGWIETSVLFSGEGRVPGTGSRWPNWMTGTSGWRGRAFSDNVVLTARKRP